MGGFGALFPQLLQLMQQQQQGNTVPSLGQIANQPVTPPFAGGQIPGIGMPPQQNPYEGLFQILNNLQNQPLQQAPQPGRVQSILEAIGGGLAVAQSKDPGSVLQQQLQGRAQQRELQTQRLQQRQSQLDQTRLQIGIQQAQDLAREQQQVRQEQRQDLQSQARETRQRAAALEDLKKTGIINQELADLEGERALKFYKDNRASILSKAEDQAYVASLPELDQKALAIATEWKTLDPVTDSVLLNELAKKVLKRNSQLTPIERQLYNRLEGLRGEETTKVRERKGRREEADISVQEAVAEATRTGQRYAGQDPYGRSFASQQAAQQSRETSAIYFKNPQTGQVVNGDQLKDIPVTAGRFDFKEMSEQEQLQERSKRMLQNAERNKRIVESEQPQNQGQVGQTGVDIDLANDKAGSRIAQLFAQQGLAATRKIILESAAPQEEKLRLMQILERLSGKKVGVSTKPGTTITPQTPSQAATSAADRLKKAQEASKKFQQNIR